MYDVYLSHITTKEYLVLLIEKGLIEYLDGDRTFKTTEKGMNFLRIYNRVQELTPVTPTLHSSRRKRFHFFKRLIFIIDIAGLSVNHGLLSLRRNIALFMLGQEADEIYPKEAYAPSVV